QVPAGDETILIEADDDGGNRGEEQFGLSMRRLQLLLGEKAVVDDARSYDETSGLTVRIAQQCHVGFHMAVSAVLAAIAERYYARLAIEPDLGRGLLN